MSSSVKLGIDKPTGKEIWLSSEARRLSTYVIGVQGMGKTNLLTHMVLSDIANGDGVCVLSPHPDLVREVLKRIPDSRRDDVIVFDPNDECPIGLNVFDWAMGGSVSMEKVADDVVTGIFRRLWGYTWGPQMEQMLRNISRTILFCQSLPVQHRPTMVEFHEIIGDISRDGKHTESAAYRNYLLAHVLKQYNTHAARMVLRFWEDFDDKSARQKSDYAASTKNKADTFAESELLYRVLGQTESKLSLREAMDESKILLVDLDVKNLGKGNVELLGSLLVGRLLIEALGRKKGEGVKPFHIVADEFSYFASPAFAELQDQARGYGVDVLIAHQRRGQLDETTKSSTKAARNWIVLATDPTDDAEELAAAFDSTPPESELRAERERLGYASYPWNVLKQQAHDVPEVTDLVHLIDSYLVLNTTWDISSWSDLREELNILEERIVTYKVRGMRHAIDLELFEKKFNRLLYLMMTGKTADDLRSDLLNLADCMFKFSVTRLEGSTSTRVPPLSSDWGETSLRTIREEVGDKWRGWGMFRPVAEARAKLDIYVSLYARVRFLRWIIELGDLLREYPVWIRGGQPIKESDRQRAFADVTQEWKNRFAHLPQYEAWVRLQEGRAIKEYHIQTHDIDDVWGKGDEASVEKIRAQSRQKYGVCRDEIEAILQSRLDVPDIRLVEEQPPGSDPVE